MTARIVVRPERRLRKGQLNQVLQRECYIPSKLIPKDNHLARVAFWTRSNAYSQRTGQIIHSQKEVGLRHEEYNPQINRDTAGLQRTTVMHMMSLDTVNLIDDLLHVHVKIKTHQKN